MAATEAQARRVARRADVKWAPQVQDPRAKGNQVHSHHGMLAVLAAAFGCGLVRLRRVEDFSADLGPRARRKLGLQRRISDTALWNLLARQTATGFRETVQQQVREFLDAKAITREFPIGVLSIDGKSNWKSTRLELEGAKSSVDEKTGLVTSSFLVLSAVLTSSSVRPCLDMEMIGAKTGESPAFRELLPRVCTAFGGQFEVVTVDAAMTARENALVVLGLKKQYLFAVKGNQPHLHQQAEDAFVGAPGPVRAHTCELRNGERLFRELHTIRVTPDEVNFPGASELWRVVQRSTGGTSETRYFISSLPADRLTAEEKLGLVRRHWGIENGRHWTTDVALEEDDVQPCQATRAAVEVVTWLRILAYNMLSVWRAGQPLKDQRPIPWARAMETLRDALVLPVPERSTTLQ